MGMSTHVCGIVPPDDDWKAQVAAFYACKQAGAPVPQLVLDALGLDDEGQEPDDDGRTIDLSERDHVPVVSEWSGEYQSGVQVDLQKLAEQHPNVKHLRFYNSW